MASWVPGQEFQEQHPRCSPRAWAAELCLYEQEQDDLCPCHRDPSCPAMSESESPGSQPGLSPWGKASTRVGPAE